VSPILTEDGLGGYAGEDNSAIGLHLLDPVVVGGAEGYRPSKHPGGVVFSLLYESDRG